MNTIKFFKKIFPKKFLKTFKIQLLLTYAAFVLAGCIPVNDISFMKILSSDFTKDGIYSVDMDGNNLVLLHQLPVMSYEVPIVTPAKHVPDQDGIAFEEYIIRTFSEYVADIKVMAHDGSNIVNLTNGMGDCRLASSPWSSDHSKILLTSRVYNPSMKTKRDIYTVNADGTSLVNLTQNPNFTDEDPKWSPDNTKIAFKSDRDGNKEIYVMNADGTNPVNVSNTPDREDVDFFWNQGSNSIVFTSKMNGTSKVFAVKDDGTMRIDFSFGSTNSNESNPQTSFFDRYIAFISDRDGNDEIYVYSTYEGTVTNVSNNPGKDQLPQWIPPYYEEPWDDVLSFVSERDGVQNIYSVNPNGTNLVKLSGSTGSEEIINFTWTPTGHKIAYYLKEMDLNNNYIYKTFISKLDGSENRDITPQGLSFTSIKNIEWYGDVKLLVVGATEGTQYYPTDSGFGFRSYDYDIYAIDMEDFSTINLNANDPDKNYVDVNPKF